MKALALALALGAIINLASGASKAQQRKGEVTVEQKPHALELSLVLDKRRYKPSDELKLQVMLVNPSSKPVYVFRTLDWGVSASLSLHLRDASGKVVKPEFPADAQTYESPDDKGAFVKLGPDHFLGANFPASIKFLNFTRPGKYSISVEYTSPFETAEVDVEPFFGKENGTIKSNVVWIEVVRKRDGSYKKTQGELRYRDGSPSYSHASLDLRWSESMMIGRQAFFRRDRTTAHITAVRLQPRTKSAEVSTPHAKKHFR